MKRKEGLGVVLRLREIEERRAQAAEARAAAQRRAADARGEHARRAYEERPMAEGLLNVVQLRALQLQANGALEALEEALAAREESAEAHRGAKDALSMASVRRKSVERVVERRSTEAARVAQAAADRALDELVVLRRAARWA